MQVHLAYGGQGLDVEVPDDAVVLGEALPAVHRAFAAGVVAVQHPWVVATGS